MKRVAGLYLLWIVAVAEASPETLGRLFFSPEQRRLFEQQRQYGLSGSDAAIRLDGVVARPGRQTTIWINGRSRDGFHADTAPALRVGESIDATSGARRDVVPDGSVRRSDAR